MRFHDLRHTMATILLESDVHPKKGWAIFRAIRSKLILHQMRGRANFCVKLQLLVGEAAPLISVFDRELDTETF